jgi:hypothetical protein
LVCAGDRHPGFSAGALSTKRRTIPSAGDNPAYVLRESYKDQEVVMLSLGDRKSDDSRRRARTGVLLAGFALLAMMPLMIYAQVTLPEDVLTTFENRCAIWGCHAGPNPAQEMDLTRESAASSIVSVRSNEKPGLLRVKPGDPLNSYLVMKIKGDANIEGGQMPLDREPLSKMKIRSIERWIGSLAAGTQIEPPERPFSQAFPGWSLSGLTTTETLARDVFLFRIAHRWRGRTSEGFDELFGLDHGAHMFVQLGFPVSNDVMFSIARSSEKATFELAGKWRFLRERTDGSVPLSAALILGIDWTTLEEILNPKDEDRSTYLSRTDGERFHLFAQLALSRKVHSRVSVLVVPGVLLNGNVGVTDEDPVVTLGLAGRLSLFEGFSLFLESVPILTGDEDAATVGGQRRESGELVFNDTFATGVEYRIGGHVFHVYVTNSLGLTTSQYMSGGSLDYAKGDFVLGFNIYRVLGLPF